MPSRTGIATYIYYAPRTAAILAAAATCGFAFAEWMPSRQGTCEREAASGNRRQEDTLPLSNSAKGNGS